MTRGHPLAKTRGGGSGPPDPPPLSGAPEHVHQKKRQLTLSISFDELAEPLIAQSKVL